MSVANRAAELRAAFDGGFAEAPPPPEPPQADLLRVHVGGDAYAIRLAGVAALHAGLPIVPLPTPARELLGVAVVRAASVPIYDLRALLGVPASGTPRWLVIAAGAPPLGFAFDAYDGHARVPASALAGGSVAIAERRYSIVDLAVLRAELQVKWPPTGNGR